MKSFDLKVSSRDWLFILILAISFSSLLSALIYLLTLGKPKLGLLTGTILGLFLGFFSFGLVHLNNNYILPRVKNQILWWIFSAIASFLAGFLGFLVSYYVVAWFGIPLPYGITENLILIGTIVGLLNYLTGLVIFLFVRMSKRKEEVERFLLDYQIQATTKVLDSHFLANILNNIIELIHRDSQLAEEYLVKLTRFLRKVFKLSTLIPIKEEVEIIEEYRQLENLRRKEKIHCEIKCEDPSLWKALFPKLGLQVLVENAITHGADFNNPLYIVIHIGRINSKLSIHVLNNGKPLQGQDIFRRGTGLTILKRRLELHGGRLKLISQDPVTFYIEFPLRI